MLEECIDLLRQIVAIPSESQNEVDYATFLKEYLITELNMETQLQYIEGRSYNVIGRWRGGKTFKRKLILGGHIDTVPPTKRWRTDPYQLVERGNELHGLGAADMKGGIAAQLMVLKRLKQERAALDAEIEFAGLADEERHSIGAHAYVALTKEQQSLCRENFFLMAEPHYHDIVIGATGKALLSIQVDGKEGHAATPESGINAIDCMCRFLTAIENTYRTKYSRGECASMCCLKIESRYGGYSLSIPDRCSCLLNKQLFVFEDIDAFTRELQEIYETMVGQGTLTIRKEIPNYPAYQLSPGQENITHLITFLRENYRHEPRLKINQSVSDGNVLYHELGVPTVLFGPLGVAFHTENEFVEKGSLSKYMDELYSYIKSEYCL